MGRLRFSHLAIISAIFLMALMAFSYVPQSHGQNDSGSGATRPLILQSEDGRVLGHFSVEMAVDEKTRAKGLMYRKNLPPERGMLFIFPEGTNISMWMANTYIPLDMIFADKKGAILKIVHKTTPLSQQIINGPKGTVWVLEILGGTAQKLGLKPGDNLILP